MCKYECCYHQCCYHSRPIHDVKIINDRHHHYQSTVT